MFSFPDRGTGSDSPDRVEQLGTYEMVWDCPFCGTQNIPAKTHQFCPNCGASQKPENRRFPSDADKKAVADHIFKGVSLICNNCSTVNDGDAKFCRQCGAPLENARPAGTIADEVRAEDATFAAQTAGVRPSSQPVAVPQERRGPNWLIIGVVGVIVLAVIGVIVALTWRRESSVAITGHSWERTITIQQFSAISDQAWCDQMPNDAYSVTSRREQRDTRQVPDGEDCSVRRVDNGDGTFSERRECTTRYRDEPIYDDRCYYSVNRWVDARQIDASGESLTDAPRWPLLQLASCTATARLGCEREGGRDEEYIISFENADGNVYTCAVPEDLWQSADENTQWNVQIGVLTGQPDCDTLERVG